MRPQRGVGRASPADRSASARRKRFFGEVGGVRRGAHAGRQHPQAPGGQPFDRPQHDRSDRWAASEPSARIWVPHSSSTRSTAPLTSTTWPSVTGSVQGGHVLAVRTERDRRDAGEALGEAFWCETGLGCDDQHRRLGGVTDDVPPLTCRCQCRVVACRTGEQRPQQRRIRVDRHGCSVSRHQAPSIAYPTPVTSTDPSGVQISRTVIWFSVRVPVLSVQMTVVLPSVSTAGSLRMTALRLAIRATPMAR